MNTSKSAKASGPRILVAGEEPTASDLGRTLSELGFEVAGITDLPGALALAEETRPALVLMDIDGPHSTEAVAAAEEIRERWRIPIVYISTQPGGEMLKGTKLIQPFNLLAKPLSVSDLNATVMAALLQDRLVCEAVENREWLRTILSSIRDGVIATDSKGCVHLMNRIAEQLTGWTQKDAMGKPIEEVYQLLDAAGRTVEHCLLRRALAFGVSPGWSKFMLCRRGGGDTFIEDSATPIHNAQGELTGAVAVFFDITERMRVEQVQTLERERLREQASQAVEALGATRSELRALTYRVLTVQEDERRRIAREIHDDASQRLALLEWEAERIGRETVPEELRSGVQRIREEAGVLSSSLRELSHRLHPAVLDDLGLAVALRSLVEEYQRQGLNATLSLWNFAGTSVEVRTSLYRMAQEALRNVQKHAPDASVHMKLADDGQQIELTFEDDGPGFDPNEAKSHPGLGLLSIEERARLIGGSFSLRTRPGAGTRLLIRIPHQTETALED